MASTAELRNLWAPACRMDPPVTFRFWNGVGVPVDGRIVPALAALNACLLQWRYAPKAGQTFGYACRRITGGTGYSLHAYGIAVDINSLSNPYHPRLITDMPAAMVSAIKAIRTKAGVPVWRWGGDFSGYRDAMHYEVQCSPGDLAAGIAGPAPGPAPVPPPAPAPKERRLMFIAYVDNGPAYLMLANGTKRLLAGSEINGLKAILPIVAAPQLIAATPDA